MNCNPGDLAVIIADPFCDGADVGKIVQVISPREPDKFGPWWLVRSHVSHLHWVTTDGRDLKEGEVADAWLRPIRPDSDPTSFESHRELEAV